LGISERTLYYRLSQYQQSSPAAIARMAVKPLSRGG